MTFEIVYLKQMESNKPSIHDLRQMYVYNDHWKSKFSVLVYPGSHQSAIFHREFHFPKHSCGVLKMNVLNADSKLDQRIGERLIRSFEEVGFLDANEKFLDIE